MEGGGLCESTANSGFEGWGGHIPTVNQKNNGLAVTRKKSRIQTGY